MPSHIDKSTRPALIHHPSDALDSFGNYDSTNQPWSHFDLQISEKIAEFERSHWQYFRHSAASSRRSTWTNQPR